MIVPCSVCVWRWKLLFFISPFMARVLQASVVSPLTHVLLCVGIVQALVIENLFHTYDCLHILPLED